MNRSNTRLKVFSLLCIFCLLLPAPSYALKVQKEKPSGAAMIGDAIVARPFLIAGTVAGLGIFIVTLPFSLLGANSADVGKELVLSPAKSSFLRCLGCTPVQDERNRLKHRSNVRN